MVIVMDYGRELAFGVFPTPNTTDLDDVFTVCHIADQSLDLIGIQDHPYQSRYVDTWTLLTWIAARTERLRLFPDVANLPLRFPAVLAKAAASLDVMSGGRVELGLGAGAFWEAITAMGGPARSKGEAVTALAEAIDVIRLMWSRERAVRYRGRHYQLAGVHPGPFPSHDIEIWLGAGGPRMLELTGRVADGWVPSSSWAPPSRLPGMQQRIDAAAAASGRPAQAIRRVYNLFGAISTGGASEFLQGPVEQWVDELSSLALEHGIDTFVFAPATDPVPQVRRFAEEIAPHVREEVARRRGTAPS